jgi:hypothetical protein
VADLERSLGPMTGSGREDAAIVRPGLRSEESDQAVVVADGVRLPLLLSVPS